jgi:hypothetical protein
LRLRNRSRPIITPLDGCIYAARRNSDADGLYRIDATGFSIQLASGTYLAGVVVDPGSGDIFSANSYTGVIYRSRFESTGRESWVTGFHAGDDDPMGMAIAPADYAGSVISPGEAIVMDGGYNGPDEIWRWSPTVAEGEFLLHVDDGTLVEATDVTINSSSIYIVDGAETAPGKIYLVGEAGALTPLATSEPLADPLGVVFDPMNGDLLILDQGDDRVVRVDPATGETDIVATSIMSDNGWAGIDITPDGRRLIVSAYDDDAIYVFGRCDVTTHPELDCNGNGIYDICDIADGAPDCNRNGLPDECDLVDNDCNQDGVPDDCPICPAIEIVFILDTSTSMDDEAAVLCSSMTHIVSVLESASLDVMPLLLGICDLPGGAYGCLENQITTLIGTAVPGSPPPGLEVLGDCTGYLEGCMEDWGLATAVVAGSYPWTPAGESIRLIIPIADEGPGCGDPVDSFDEAATAHAINVAQANGVIVSPITGTGSSAAVISLAQSMADATGGAHFNSSEPALDIADAIVALVTDACSSYTDCNENGVLDECDIASGTSTDNDGNGVPDECDVAASEDLPPGPRRFGLDQNWPNPFNPQTAISFHLPVRSVVSLRVFDVGGRLMRTLVDGDTLDRGRHEILWGGRDQSGRQLPSGTYFYRLEAGEYVETKRMTLLK